MELLYQSKDGWFSSKCSKINHSSSIISSSISKFVPSYLKNWGGGDGLVQVIVDDLRGILFTLSQKSTISVYYLGDDGGEGGSLHKILAKTQSQMPVRAIEYVFLLFLFLHLFSCIFFFFLVNGLKTLLESVSSKREVFIVTIIIMIIIFTLIFFSF